MSEASDTDPSLVREARQRAVTVLRPVSITRLGGVVGAGIVAYFAFVVPDELAVLLGASMAGAALIGLLPLVVVFVVVRAPV